MKTTLTHSKPGLLGLLLAGIAIAIVVTGLSGRRSHAKQLAGSAADAAIPTVTLLAAKPAPTAALELPARIEAWATAPIYARVSGYLKSWQVDIGGSVKANQELGQIETPDLDQQLLQAKAELATASSNLALARTTAKRWQGLLESDSVSRQEADEKNGDLAARQSTVGAMQANVDRVRALHGYTRLTAPFDGIVTERNTDVGALINVGSTPGAALFVVSDVHRLRVYVSVPQRQAAMIRLRGSAQLTVPERPGRHYAATVQSLSKAINAASGTMLVQLVVNNDAGDLLPGGYATMRFDAQETGARNMSLPPAALIFGKNGTQVATVDASGHVLLKRVTVSRDLGNALEISDGLGRSDRVINNPPDGLASGDVVRIAAAGAGEAR